MGGKDKKNTGPLDIADSRIYIYQDGKEINTNRAGSPISISISISIVPAYSDGPAASPASAHTHTHHETKASRYLHHNTCTRSGSLKTYLLYSTAEGTPPPGAAGGGTVPMCFRPPRVNSLAGQTGYLRTLLYSSQLAHDSRPIPGPGPGPFRVPEVLERAHLPACTPTRPRSAGGPIPKPTHPITALQFPLEFAPISHPTCSERSRPQVRVGSSNVSISRGASGGIRSASGLGMREWKEGRGRRGKRGQRTEGK
ncbi:hypothetical protein P167DRAFT_361591 [Morchella conica CCBAS932]|uniref:Uncharacterized protein n=1 Tax=Morchella conica CCBAS932 TaxID=1392247 RepID=A0A3N4KIT5_9PEZI|nr:hypothetical protein P167DRAFT_361591 [Morchella conica CCBAS932]